MSIRTRILIIIGLAMVALTSIIAFNALQVRSNLMAEKKLKTRHLVEAAYGVLEFWHAKQKAGAIDEETAQREAAGTIKAMRYEGKEYFWLNDFTTPVPKMVMHSTVPALDGKVLDAEKFNCATSMQEGVDGPVVSTDGKMNLFVAFNEVANKAGTGYVTYDWPKPAAGGGTTKELYPKMSYVKKFEDWNWLIGSGIYIDDVSDAVVARLVRDAAIAGGIAFLLLGFSLMDLPKIDVVLLSHNHYDHLDMPTLIQLHQRWKPLVVTGLGNFRYLARAGINQVVELDWWKSCEIAPELRVTYVPAQHWSHRWPLDRRKALWGGHVVHAPAGSVYFAGDTGYPGDFKGIRERLGSPDIALLPIGAYEPRWFMRKHHMNPDDAVRAHLDLAARMSIAMHWGVFQMTDEAIDDPLSALDQARREQSVGIDEFRVLDFGERLHLDIDRTGSPNPRHT